MAQRLGRAIKGGRTSAGLTQERFAEMLSAADEADPVHQTAVSKWEVGKASPRPSRFATIERILDLDPGTLARAAGLSGEDTLQISAEGVDLDELRDLDPEAYDHVVDVARRELERARRARGA